MAKPIRVRGKYCKRHERRIINEEVKEITESLRKNGPKRLEDLPPEPAIVTDEIDESSPSISTPETLCSPNSSNINRQTIDQESCSIRANSPSPSLSNTFHESPRATFSAFIQTEETLDFDSDEDPQSSDDEWGEDEIEDPELCPLLAYWAIECHIPGDSVTKLLATLHTQKKNNTLMRLPIQGRTVLRTPRTSEPLIEVSPGLYWHNGLKREFEKHKDEISKSKTDTINLTVSIDGLPLRKSSPSQLYPISGSIPCVKKILLIGCYHGNAKPDDFNEFLKYFVEELIELIENGFECNGKLYKVRLVMLICDAPAKSACLYIVGHTGYFSCTKCVVKGESLSHRVCFPSTNAKLRTDEDFAQQTQEQHHKGVSILISIPHFGLISGVPLDYMHLICLGVVRKILYILKFGRHNLSQDDIKRLTELLLNLIPYIPREFCRKPRSLEYVKFWKATEYRQFLLYTGPVVLRSILPSYLYKHFCTLHVAIRILCSRHLTEYTAYCEDLLKDFVAKFEKYYGRYLISHNVHNLPHLPRDVDEHGILDDFSAFKFENFLQFIKKIIRKAQQPLQQLYRRYSEIDSCNFVTRCKEMKQFDYASREFVPLLGYTAQCYLQFRKGDLVFKSNDRANKYCQLLDKTIVIVEKFVVDRDSVTYVIGRSFLQKDDFLPLRDVADLVGVYFLSSESDLRMWPVTEIWRKYVVMPCENRLVGFPMLHCELPTDELIV